MRYEWDPEKRNANWRKHRIRFEDAIRVFDDPYRNDVDATEDEYGEERQAVIGRMDQSRLAVLLVVYTDRPPDLRTSGPPDLRTSGPPENHLGSCRRQRGSQ